MAEADREEAFEKALLGMSAALVRNKPTKPLEWIDLVTNGEANSPRYQRLVESVPNYLVDEVTSSLGQPKIVAGGARSLAKEAILAQAAVLMAGPNEDFVAVADATFHAGMDAALDVVTNQQTTHTFSL